MKEMPPIPATEWKLNADKFIEIDVFKFPWEIMYELSKFLADDERIVEGKLWMRIQKVQKTQKRS